MLSPMPSLGVSSLDLGRLWQRKRPLYFLPEAGPLPEPPASDADACVVGPTTPPRSVRSPPGSVPEFEKLRDRVNRGLVLVVEKSSSVANEAVIQKQRAFRTAPHCSLDFFKMPFDAFSLTLSFLCVARKSE